MSAQKSGEEYRELMKRSGKTPAGFADFLGISMSTLTNLFRNKPVHQNTLLKITEKESLLRSQLKTSA